MDFARPLSPAMAERYHSWRSAGYAEHSDLHKKLADDGQTPQAMVLSCCDSRVQADAIFDAGVGEIFVDRSVANLVPPNRPGQDYNSTSAAIEYAVTALKVPHLIVMGHTQCGGVNACHQMCSGKAPELETETSFVGQWMNTLRPAYERVQAKGLPDEDQVPALEREGIILSLENLMTYPYVKERVESGDLALHGLLFNIRSGVLEQYMPDSGTFQPV